MHYSNRLECAMCKFLNQEKLKLVENVCFKLWCRLLNSMSMSHILIPSFISFKSKSCHKYLCLHRTLHKTPSSAIILNNKRHDLILLLDDSYAVFPKKGNTAHGNWAFNSISYTKFHYYFCCFNSRSKWFFSVFIFKLPTLAP